MNDEKYIYLQDIREKKVTSHSAANKVGGARSTRCTLPSDYLSQKEIESMSSECVTYNINKRMTWKEFKKLPDDVKRLYIKNIRQKYDVSDLEIAKMIDVNKRTLGFEIRRIGLGQGAHTRGRTRPENKARFYKDFGIEQETESVPCEAVESDVREERENEESARVACEVSVEAKEQSEKENEEPAPNVGSNLPIAIPERCTFVFNGSVSDSLRALHTIIGSGCGVLTVTFCASENDRTAC